MALSFDEVCEYILSMRKPSYNKDGSFKEWKWIKKPKWNDEVEEEEDSFINNMQRNLEYQMKLRGIK